MDKVSVKGDSFDEFGVPYYKAVLQQENVYAYHYDDNLNQKRE